jgi:hypothetical protein
MSIFCSIDLLTISENGIAVQILFTSRYTRRPYAALLLLTIGYDTVVEVKYSYRNNLFDEGRVAGSLNKKKRNKFKANRVIIMGSLRLYFAARAKLVSTIMKCLLAAYPRLQPYVLKVG